MQKKSILIFFYILIILSAFFNYVSYDEAWNFAMAENFAKYQNMVSFHGLLLNEYFYQAFYQSKIYLFFNSINYYFFYRILSLFCTLLSFFFLNKILNNYFTNQKRYFIFSYILFVYWFCFHTGGVSSRPDSIVAFALIYFIYSVININSYKIFFITSTIINFTVLLLHPNIIPIIAINILLIFYFFYKNIFFWLFAIIPLALSIFLFSNLLIDFFSNYLNGLSRYIQVDNLNSLIFFNFKNDVLLNGRYHHLFIYYPITYFVLFLNYTLILMYLFFIRNYKNILFNFILFLFFYLSFFLLLIPNKWLHHFAIIFILFSLLLPYILSLIEEKFNFIFDVKFKNKIIMFISTFFVIILIGKSYYYFDNNYFLYKFISENLGLNKIYSKKMLNNVLIIDQINLKAKNQNFIGDPIFKYIINSSNYEGNQPHLMATSPDFIIIDSNFETCKTYNKFNENFKFKVSFNINDKNWHYCEKIKF